MPGIKSLQDQQYYAHPQNAFWKIMSALFDMPIETYPQRVKLIKDNNLALWDTLKCCVRTGSLDAAIEADTIEVNDFADFLKKHPKVTHIFCNGAAAAKTFNKHIMPRLTRDVITAQLPSTSPAHAGMTFKDKLKAWAAVKRAAIS